MAARFSRLFFVVVAIAGCSQQTASDGLPVVPLHAPPPVVKPAPVVAKVAPAPVKPQPAPLAVPRHAAAVSVPTDWIPAAPPRPWQWIIIHHSATSFGNAHIMDGWHRDKGWDELGYHFVVDNGSSGMSDGQIEVGPRWPKQKWGAHTKTADNRFNDFGIGICLVGNFDVDHPSAAQMKAVARLVSYLMRTYHIPPDHVIGHGDAKPTDCPGRFMSVADVRHAATALLSAQAVADPAPSDKGLVDEHRLASLDDASPSGPLAHRDDLLQPARPSRANK